MCSWRCQFEGFQRVLECCHRKSHIFQQARGCLQLVNIIFNKEDWSLSAYGFILAKEKSCPFALHSRKEDLKGGSFVLFWGNVDGALVTNNYSVYNSQSQPRTFRLGFCREEGIENFVDDFLRYTRAIINYGEFDVLFGFLVPCQFFIRTDKHLCEFYR